MRRRSLKLHVSLLYLLIKTGFKETKGSAATTRGLLVSGYDYATVTLGIVSITNYMCY